MTWACTAIQAIKAAQSVRSRILELLKLSRELNADVLGFGNLFTASSPGSGKIEASWDEIYPALDVTVEVEYNLTRGHGGGSD